MTRTLDGKALKIKGFRQTCEVVNTQADKWEETGYTREVHVHGSFRTFQLECWEDAKSWPSSDVKHFEDLADAGETVTFTFSDGNLHSLSCTVKILSVDFDLNLSCSTADPLRMFSLSLQEVS